MCSGRKGRISKRSHGGEEGRGSKRERSKRPPNRRKIGWERGGVRSVRLSIPTAPELRRNANAVVARILNQHRGARTVWER
jgi:hypothetical protein